MGYVPPRVGYTPRDWSRLDEEQAGIVRALWGAEPRWWQFGTRWRIARALARINAAYPEVQVFAPTGNLGTR